MSHLPLSQEERWAIGSLLEACYDYHYEMDCLPFSGECICGAVRGKSDACDALSMIHDLLTEPQYDDPAWRERAEAVGQCLLGGEAMIDKLYDAALLFGHAEIATRRGTFEEVNEAIVWRDRARNKLHVLCVEMVQYDLAKEEEVKP